MDTPQALRSPTRPPQAGLRSSTLIELLVVISIILASVVLLLPPLSGARYAGAAVFPASACGELYLDETSNPRAAIRLGFDRRR